MGNGFLLVLAVYYTDVFDGRCSGFQVTTLGFSEYCSLVRLLLYTKHIYFSKSIPVVDGVSK
jgi:hypothetical protein